MVVLGFDVVLGFCNISCNFVLTELFPLQMTQAAAQMANAAQVRFLLCWLQAF